MAHENTLAIGSLSTDCTALVWPDTRPAMLGVLDRVTGDSLLSALSVMLDTVMEGHDGVVRIRKLQLEVDYLGVFDEAALVHVLALRIAGVLRDVLINGQSKHLRHWPDQATYIAAYIERRLALTVNPAPSWAFGEFATLEHLPPERAAAEILLNLPETLIPLAKNGSAENEPERFARALDEVSARALIDALLDTAAPQSTADALLAAFQRMDLKLQQLAIDQPAKAALRLVMILLAESAKPDIPEALFIATLAAAILHLRHNEVKHGVSTGRTVPPSATLSESTHKLSPTVISLLGRQLDEPAFRQRIEDIMPADLASAPSDEVTNSAIVSVTPDHLHSPLAGVGLLLPVIADFCLTDHLTPRQLHDAIVSILGNDQQVHATTDPFFASIFPFDRHDPNPSFLSIPDDLKARLAPETLPLLSGKEANAWGGLILAAFASRLPGLKASSGGYLQTQFLHTPGRLTVGEESLDLTLQGPDLAIILKMAGFSGVQRKLPHLGNRLLVITLTGLSQ